MSDLLSQFLIAATVPLDSGHTSGTLERAAELLAADPSLAGANIFAAAVLGDDALVRGFLAHDASLATAAGGPHGWDALTHLCFSRYLQHDRTRDASMLRAAQALLDAGANANTGFKSQNFAGDSEWECVLYGAAGVAHHGALTALLLQHGADANDGEVTYHTPESYDLSSLRALLAHGTLNADSLATLLLRKCDWHDEQGVALLLEYGADPNRMTRWHRTALQQAIVRDNRMPTITRLIDAGAPDGATQAVYCGRRDVLDLLEARGMAVPLHDLERLLHACTRGELSVAQDLALAQPALLGQLRAMGGDLMLSYARVGNADGLHVLITLGLSPDIASPRGDGYWGLAAQSTALHGAAWRAHPAAVQMLLTCGANVNARDAHGRTPLTLARKAAVDSYWNDRVPPELEPILLGAGATA